MVRIAEKHDIQDAHTLGEDLTHLRRLKDAATQADAIAKEVKARRTEHLVYCRNRMEDEDVDSQTRGGYSFARTSTIYAQIQDRRSFVAWATEHEPDLVQTTERKGDLNALVRQRIDDGQGLPPGVGFYEDENISVRKAAGKR